MTNIIKIILTALFFLCLINMTYGFYQFVRFSALIGFTILAYQSSQQSNKTEMIVFIFLAILFQPLIKISLGRDIWNVIDVVVGLGLIISIFWKRK